MVIKDPEGVKKTSLKKFRHRDPDRGNFAVFNRTLLINVNRGNLCPKNRNYYKF